MKTQLFEWDKTKDLLNINKHGVAFEYAKEVFDDPFHVITEDGVHSNASEQRYFCFGMVGGKVMTVRFTLRQKKIRIIGAAFWREGKKEYEKQNRL
jgi:uncharacterized DUF497 family protein